MAKLIVKLTAPFCGQKAVTTPLRLVTPVTPFLTASGLRAQTVQAAAEQQKLDRLTGAAVASVPVPVHPRQSPDPGGWVAA